MNIFQEAYEAAKEKLAKNLTEALVSKGYTKAEVDVSKSNAAGKLSEVMVFVTVTDAHGKVRFSANIDLFSTNPVKVLTNRFLRRNLSKSNF